MQNSVNLTQNFYTRLTTEKLHLQEGKHVLSISCLGLVKPWWAATSWARVSRGITDSLPEYMQILYKINTFCHNFLYNTF